MENREAGTVTAESQLLEEMNAVAQAYARAQGEDRRILLRQYVAMLQRLTDCFLADLTRPQMIVARPWRYKCGAARSGNSRSASIQGN